ncbi:MAG: helix-hairpin-helix domain-containing protein [Bacteroidales bacterium]|nr:helix-hairpin-helix domain-containing protein [Bacteroidales bacterium]MBN2697764.1 helix-hairpin-helix domain-containing protein [Bacteroidales bacterium]
MKNIIREFLLLTRGEQRGLLVVSAILLISVIIRITVRLSPSNTHFPEQDSEILLEAQQLLETLAEKESRMESATMTSGIIPEEALKMHDFNPNTVTLQELSEMKLPGFPSGNIIKYRNAGGRFKKPEDLLRIYGIDTSLFRKMQPYIIIPPEKEPDSLRIFPVPKRSWVRIELNKADSGELLRLPGIGPVFAGRIVRYRNILGGFSDLSQLHEVYGLDSFLLGCLDSLVTIDTGLIAKININRADFITLLRHPYLGREEAMAIIQYRDFAKKINSPDELSENIEFDSGQWKKVRSYLSVSDPDSLKHSLH